ncbi:hypothetical protein SCP_1603320 [Sparassis crispa]|uniref:SAP domain-containing protein n=1 Tax=Sparassis crispa TaxID=139825 RepID=A0A401H5F1_9APHY|nr:hypothetical protein SCP_1603320 [Sparassis crispa]GBE89668.1 hypothetical protein SCP_1603320 [Sparassis crispa]
MQRAWGRGPPERSTGRLCQCTTNGCGGQTQEDPATGRIVQGKFVSEVEYQDHRKKDLRAANLRSQQENLPGGGGGGTITTAPSWSTHPSASTSVSLLVEDNFPPPYPFSRPDQHLSLSEEVDTSSSNLLLHSNESPSLEHNEHDRDQSSSEASQGVGRKITDSEKRTRKIASALDRLLQLRDLFHQHSQPHITISDRVVFQKPPDADAPLPAPLERSETGEAIEVNAGIFSLRYNIPDNMPILEYEAWLMNHLIRLEGIRTHDMESAFVKQQIRDEILKEWDRLQGLKRRAWELQRAAPTISTTPPAGPAAQHDRFSVSTARFLKPPMQNAHVISIACYITIAVLFLVCHLSTKESGFALSCLQLIVELCLSFNEGISPRAREIVNTIPADVRTVIDTLNLQPSTKTFVCCPRCYSLYLPNSCPELCTFCDTPASTPCQGKLRKQQTIKGRTFTFPSRSFHYHDLKQWVGELMCRPGMEKLMDRDVYAKTSGTDSTMHDVWDGEVLQSFRGPDGEQFVMAKGAEGRYIFSLAMDGFNPFSNKAVGKRVSSTGIYMVCLNLPREYRYRMENMFLVGIIPGPTEPSLHEINHLLRPLVDDLLDFWDPGVWYSSTPQHPTGRLVRCAVVPLICDLPAARQVAGFASFSTLKHFCSFCHLHRHDIKNLDPSTWRPRSDAEHQHWADAWRKAQSEEERDTLVSDHGVRYSELLRLPYWKPVLYTMVDTMHAFLQAILKRHCRVIWGMDVKFMDGDGLEPSDDGSAESFEDEMDRARIAFRTGSKTALGKFPIEILRALAIDYATIEPAGRKAVLMKRLVQHRISCGWFNDSGKLVKEPAPGELPEVADLPGDSSPEQLDAAQEFLCVAPSTTALSELTKPLLLALCNLHVESKRGLEKLTKKELVERLGAWRIQTGLADREGKILVPDPERLTAARTARSKTKASTVLGKERLQAIWDDMDTTVLPSWILPAPFHIGDGRHGKITADQWRSFCTIHLVITLGRLWGPLEPANRHHQLLENFMDPVTAMKLSTMRATSPERIGQYQIHYLRYLRELLVLFPDVSLTPYHHLAVHLVDQLCTFGPTHSVWTFVFERVNHVLQQINKNNKLGQMEQTMYERFCMAQRLRSIIQTYAVSSPLKRIAAAFKKYFDLGARGILFTDMLSFEAKAVQGLAPYGLELREDQAQERTLPPRQRLDTTVVALLNDYYDKHFGRASARGVRPQGVIEDKFLWDGVKFTTFQSSPRDSYVVTGNLPLNWSPARITKIFTHTADDKDSQGTTRTFFVVQRYRALGDAIHDPYRAFPYVGGRLYYNEIETSAELLAASDILCHFALTPYASAKTERALIHVLPLDRVHL